MTQLKKGESVALESVNPSSLKFCRYVAHELANPLTAMLASIDGIERQLEFNLCTQDDIEDLLKILRSETVRLINLLWELGSSQVLTEAKEQPISLAAEISDLLDLQSAYYAERHIGVNQEIPFDQPSVIADRHKLRQVLLNLCNNAVEAMPGGGTLTFRSYAAGEWACLDIVDTGCGIPEGMQIFEPGITTKAQSSGIGLTIVRELVKQHGGTISYTSRVGSGTTFHLKFPVHHENKSGSPSARVNGHETPF